MAKKSRTKIIPRMKTFDQRHKGGKKAKLDATNIKNAAALGTPVARIFEDQKPINY